MARDFFRSLIFLLFAQKAFLSTNVRFSLKILFSDQNDRISLNISPSFAYLIKSTISSSSNDPLFTQINNEELEESNSLDIGLLTGVDFYVTENLFINTSVCTGFFPIESDENDSYSAKNISYILSLGYIF